MFYTREGGLIVDGGRGVERLTPPPLPSLRVPPEPRVCTTYFLGPMDGPIKIGRASRLSFRLRELQLANAFPVELWASIDGPPSLELEYHRRFKAHRLHGEWFERCPEILEEINRLRPMVDG